MSIDKKRLLKSNDEYNYGSTSSSSTSTTEHPADPNSIDLLPYADTSSTLSFLQKFGFGLGHVYNDLCAGIWFSYTLLFMQGALQIPAAEASALIMVGQVSDAIATPIIGILADKFGTKRMWHIAGTVVVILSFSPLYSVCPWCTTAPMWWKPTYLAAVILLIHVGWASVQVSHLAMIPELCKTARDRTDLNAIRYSASVTSNVVLYVVTWLVFKSHLQNDSSIGSGDAYRFRDVSLILTLVGITMTVLFHFSLPAGGYSFLRQQALTADRISDSTDAETPRRQKNFLKSPLLYQNAFLYVFSRLFVTTSMMFIPLWLNERGDKAMAEDNNVEYIATVPLVSFLSSFLASIAMKYSTRIGHRASYLLGSVVGISGCVWVALAAPSTAPPVTLFSIAILFGVGSSFTMISSLCITADMIGQHADQSGVIYSAVTFSDKLISGVVVVVIGALKCDDRIQCPEYYKDVLAYACGAAAILGVFTLATLQCNRRRP